MDVDILTLPLKVTVGLVVWTIALVTYRIFQAVVWEQISPGTKSKLSCPTEPAPECQNHSREYFLRLEKPCRCGGVISGVVTFTSGCDRFCLANSDPGFSQMDETLHVRLTGLMKPFETSSDKKRTLGTVVEIENDSESNSTTSSVTSGGLPPKSYRGSFTLPHGNCGTPLYDNPYVDDRLPQSDNFWKNRGQRLENSHVPYSEYANQNIPRNTTPFSAEDLLPASDIFQKKITPCIKNDHVLPSECDEVNQASSKNASPSYYNQGDLLDSKIFFDNGLTNVHISQDKSTPSMETGHDTLYSTRNLVNRTVSRNPSPPISIIPVTTPSVPFGSILSNSGPQYSQLCKKLHEELSRFNVQKKTLVEPTNLDNSHQVSDDHCIIMVEDYAPQVPNENLTSPTVVAVHEKKPSVLDGTNGVGLVYPSNNTPPSITPRVKQNHHYNCAGLKTFKPECTGYETVPEQHLACGMSQKNGTCLDSVQNQNQNVEEIPRIVAPSGLQCLVKPHASVRQELKLPEKNHNCYQIGSEHGVKMLQNYEDKASVRLPSPDQNCGYGKIVQKTRESTSGDIIENKNSNQPVHLLPDEGESENSGLRSLSVKLETIFADYKHSVVSTESIPGQFMSDSNHSDSSNNGTSSSDGWLTTWEDSPSPSPDLDIKVGDLIPTDSQKRISGKVIEVVDGDGLTLMLTSKQILGQSKCVDIRLAGIDAPEHNQAFFEESKNHLEELVLRERVKVDTFGLDQYGRCLGMVYLPPSCNVNLEMVKSGYAHVYTGKDAVYGEYEEDFKTLEEEAKLQKKGLWIQDNVVHPRDWKRMKNQGW